MTNCSALVGMLQVSLSCPCLGFSSFCPDSLSCPCRHHEHRGLQPLQPSNLPYDSGHFWDLHPGCRPCTSSYCPGLHFSAFGLLPAIHDAVQAHCAGPWPSRGPGIHATSPREPQRAQAPALEAPGLATPISAQLPARQACCPAVSSAGP